MVWGSGIKKRFFAMMGRCGWDVCREIKSMQSGYGRVVRNWDRFLFNIGCWPEKFLLGTKDE